MIEVCACIYYPMPLLGDSRRWCSVRVGLQKHHHQIPVGKEAWSATYSFLIHNLQSDMVRRTVHVGVRVGGKGVR